MREPVANDQCPSLGDLVLASDGGLSPEHKAEMTAHLRECEACTERLRQANAFMEASAELDDDAVTGESGVVDAGQSAAALSAAGLSAAGDIETGAPESAASAILASVNLASGSLANANQADGNLASRNLAGGDPMNRRGVNERVENVRAARRGSFDEEVGAKYDSAEKGVARNREFLHRLHRQKQDVILRPTATTAWVRRWLPAAAVIPLLIVGLAFPRMQTVVRAEELLNLASTHERSLPADRVQRLRIELTPSIPAFAPLVPGDRTRAAARPRVKPFLDVRTVTGSDAAGARRSSINSAGISGASSISGTGSTDSASGAGGEFAAIDEMLAQEGFDWRQPLSLAGVRAWRLTPGEKHDEVFVSADVLVLKTTASQGSLREVELTVRRHDYHVIKLVLAFEGIGRLEISEIEQSLRAAKATPATPIPSAPVAMTTTPSAAIASRGVMIDAALSPVTTVVGRAPVMQPGLSRWLERTFGARPERKAFVPDLQRLVVGVRQNLSALDTLGRRYPEVEVVEQWSGADRAALRRRVDESYRRISRDLNELDARVGILFGSTTRLLPVTEAPADWRQRAAAALAHAEAMDSQVRQLLTFDDVPSRDTRDPRDTRVTGAAQVPSTFAALWDVVHAPVGGPASR